MIAFALLVAVAASSSKPVSLCKPAEVLLFSCPIRRKTVSICGMNGKATYRYGSPGHVELSSNALHIANSGTSGGGETQISFTNEGVSYVVYDKTVRTTFGGNGNTPDFISGLAIRKNDKTLSSTECSAEASILSRARDYIPTGNFIEH